MSWIAIACFLVVIAITLGITYFAARRTQSAADFYVAGGRISGTQNGLAIAGDFLSAATLLGTTAMIFTAGFDAAIYISASMVAFVFFLFLMTDKLRALGRFTFVDILVTRLEERPIRLLAASTVAISFAIAIAFTDEIFGIVGVEEVVGNGGIGGWGDRIF